MLYLGADLGSGRQHAIGDFDTLRLSEVRVLEILLKWDYQAVNASPLNIATRGSMSYSTVWFALNYLKSRGFVRRSSKGSWFMPEHIKEHVLKAESKPKDTISASETE